MSVFKFCFDMAPTPFDSNISALSGKKYNVCFPTGMLGIEILVFMNGSFFNDSEIGDRLIT